jgi:hypothetical protein
LGSVIIGLLLLLPPRPVDTLPVVNAPPDLKGRLQLRGLPDEKKKIRSLLDPKFTDCKVEEYRLEDLP